MSRKRGDEKGMPNIPKLDFEDALAEIWSQINFAAYHLAYVKVYTQSDALRVRAETLRDEKQPVRDNSQVDVIICRTHLAAFFWHLEHLFESLRTAIKQGQKEYPQSQYFRDYKTRMEKIEKETTRREIKDYRNRSHQIPAIIGAAWDNDGHFLHHFLPTITGHHLQEDVDLNVRLQRYFEFAANVWLEFAPGSYKESFPRDFKFPVTVPYLFSGEIPKELNKVPQLYVSIQSSSHDKHTEKIVEDK